MAERLFCAVLFCALSSASGAQPFSLFTRTDLPAAMAVGVVSADFNDDGIPDIAAVGGVNIRVFLGAGNRQFHLASTIPLPGSPNSFIQLVAADFSSDGKPDLAVFGGTGFLLLGNGDGTFRTGVTLASTSYPAATADFNGDGKPDLAVSMLAKNSFRIAVLLGKGDGTFAAPLVIPGSVPDCLAAADLNGDRKPDLATCDLVYPGAGDGTFLAGIPFSLPSPADFVAIGDLNQDGKQDLVAIKQYANGINPDLGPVYVIYGNGDGTFQPALQVHSDVGTLLPAAAIGDLDGDGRPDIAVLGAGGLVGVLTNNGNNGFNRGEVLPVTYFDSLPWASLAVADLTGDHHMDIVAAGNSSRYFSVLFHNNKGGFRDVENLAFPEAGPAGTIENQTPVAQSDFNGDGLPDLAFVVDANGSIFIATFLGTGDPSRPFKPGPRTDLALGPGQSVAGMAMADFNGDGKMDLAICFSTISGVNLPGTVHVYFGNGDGTFTQVPGALNLPLTAFQMTAADFNGDGRPDLAFTSGYLALGNGDGTFGPPAQFYPSDPNHFGAWVGAADFNHDGNMDLAFQVCQGCEIQPPLLIYLGNGNGSFQAPTSYLWNGLAQTAAIADLNKDGIPDIVTLNFEQGPNVPIAAVFLGAGDGTFQPPSYVFDIWALQPNRIAVADLNGDGNPDLAIADWQDNSVYLFAGNGDGTFGRQVQVGGAAGMSWLSALPLQGQTKPGFPDLVLVDFLPNGFYPVNTTGMAVSILFNNGWR